MKYSAALVLAASVIVAAADPDCSVDAAYEELTDVCLPLDSTGHPDFNAPCNGMLAIQYQCAFGPAAGLNLVNEIFANTTNNDDDIKLPPTQDNSTQRACICQSQFFNAVNGCLACQRGHGDLSARDVTPAYLSSVSSAYCAVSATPTQGLADYLAGVAEPTSTNTAATGVYTDPIGNKTAVSLYYNAPVTGTSVYLIPTSTATTTSTSNGQIVATQATNNAAAAASTPAAAKGAASKLQVAAAGVFGLVGLAALL